MKKCVSILVLLAALQACGDPLLDFPPQDKPTPDSLKTETNLNVSMAEVVKVIKRTTKIQETKSGDLDITPIVFQNDTLLYVANLNPGGRLYPGTNELQLFWRIQRRVLLTKSRTLFSLCG